MAVLPSLEVTVTTKLYVPTRVGLPLITPVPALSVKPFGSEPDSAQVTGELQLLDDNVAV